MSPPTDDTRRFAPAAARNRDPIRAALLPELPGSGLVLEIASGSGEHTMHIAASSPTALIFQPTDPDPAALASIDAWRTHLGLSNVLPALALDAASASWPVTHAGAIICINMVHIAPWSAAEGLMRGARRVLPAGGLLYLYGPFRRDGRHTSPGNAAFDISLRAENPDWGVRDLEAVSALAQTNGFGEPRIMQMPANNMSLVFRRLA